MEAPLLPQLPGYDNPQLIAHGTTALVFRATQTRLNRLVAIKVITVDTGSVPVNAARELATTVSLSSQPHIVSIIDTGMTSDDRPYIVMEYCEGGSYAQILRRGGPLAVDDVIEVGIKIGEALHAAHQAGIVHRDVKPSNILRSKFGPALTDFGIARAPDELSSTLTREMMTPHHASPEALLHQAQSGLSDVYSLASTLWTLLIGHPPFVDPSRPAVDMYVFRDRVLHDPVPPMERDDVPAWLLSELRRAMAKLPSQRHASAAAFAEALRRGALGLDPNEPVSDGGPRPVIPVQTAWGTPGMPLDRVAVDRAADGSGSGPARTAAGRADPDTWTPPPGVPAWLPTAPPVPPNTAPAPSSGPPAAGAAGPLPAPPVPPATGTTPPVSPSGPPAPAPVLPAPPAPPGPRLPAGPPVPPVAPADEMLRQRPSGYRPSSPYDAPPDAAWPARPSAVGEDGWLAPLTAAGSAAGGGPGAVDRALLPQVSPRYAAHPTRRFAEADLTARARSRTGLIIGLCLATMLAVAAGAVITLIATRSPQGTATPTRPPVTTPVAPPPTGGGQPVPAVGGAPTDVKLTDHGASITLTWQDPSAGTAAFLVTGTGPDGRQLSAQQVPQGLTTATFSGLRTTGRYCFRVIAVYSVDNVKPAPAACTNRRQ